MIDNIDVRDRLQEVAAFSGLPRNYARYAQHAWMLIEDDITGILNNFYDFIEDSGFPAVTDSTNRARLIETQVKHWEALFSATFSDDYIASIKAIGLKHRLNHLSPSAYISGYGFLSARIIRNIIDTLKGQPEEALMISQTIQSLIFIDMSLALSVYNDEVELL